MDKICQLKHVYKQYNKKIFEDFNLSVEKGEILTIAGESGKGKTTLLNMIGMLDTADQGEIRLFGERIPKITSKRGKILLRDRLFYLFQNYALIDDKDVEYNLDVPLLQSKKSAYEKKNLKLEALKKVGLETPLKQKIYQLSGGEQQRVAIARVFLKPFDLILADEPTGSLDAENKKEILELLKVLNKMGKTVIIVSHDAYIMQNCDRVVYL